MNRSSSRILTYFVTRTLFSVSARAEPKVRSTSYREAMMLAVALISYPDSSQSPQIPVKAANTWPRAEMPGRRTPCW